MSEQPWGSKFTISIYVEGTPEKTTEWINAALENFALPPGTDFVGLRYEPVQDKPKDQGAT